jgi:hypothetical protein
VRSGIFAFATAFLFSTAASGASLHEAFSQGKYQGQLRIYDNVQAFQQGSDKYGTAFGGRLAFETNAQSLLGFSAGFAYYTSNDLSTNHDDPAARTQFTPTVDIDILGEAYLRWSGFNSVVTAGRQLITTPFLNPSDAFMIPITYSGYSVINKSIQNVTLQAYNITEVKSRQADAFADMSRFAAARVGGTSKNTAGDNVFGAVFDREGTKAQAWEYLFTDLFNLTFLEAEHGRAMGDAKVYGSAHFGMQNDQGEKLLGEVDTQLYGVKVGVRSGGADFSLAGEQVAGGRFLSPYTFFTDALYTNSMITGMSNVEAGNGWKAMLTYDFTEHFWGKISHSRFDFAADKDFSESDLDLRYTFAKESDFTGLSLLGRVGYRDGSNNPAGYTDLIEYRAQVQYLF